MKENPCTGCNSKKTKRKAPCCWENELEVTGNQYATHFSGQEGVIFLSSRYDEWSGQDIVTLRNNGACPKLDQETGLCSIQDDKPESCTYMQALVHPLCCKAPDGRQ